MIECGIDEEVDPVLPTNNIDQLALLLSLLTGEKIYLVALCKEAKDAIEEFLAKVREISPEKINLSYEEFNELLLLFNQDRLERPFFNFFFLGDSKTDDFIEFSMVKNGVKKFRVFALLCYGNFRVAFKELSREKNNSRFRKRLDPWNRNSKEELNKFTKRQVPLTPLVGSIDEIGRDDTWFTGYLSSSILDSDGKALDQIIDTKNTEQLKAVLHEEDLFKILDGLKTLSAQLDYLSERKTDTMTKSKRNTVKYLTWDYLDVYVATSMRQIWEFKDTYDFINKVFKDYLPKMITGVRWFDPTQSYCESPIDKGLVEGLMLKRAKCTIYMAQETDTLGKDSELAATLAQGKPVIAFVSKESVHEWVKRLENKPLKYYQQRLLMLWAEGFIDKKDNRSRVCELLADVGIHGVSINNLKHKVHEALRLFNEHFDGIGENGEGARSFQYLGNEEEYFREKRKKEIAEVVQLLAAIESHAAEVRAKTLKFTHPLNMQIHLENGVANGVLVVRSEEECAKLVSGFLTNDLEFDVKLAKEEKQDEPIATILCEKITGSRFRVVTRDPCITNSFWNFYGEEKGGENE